MISAKKMQSFRQGRRYENGTSITLESVKNALAREAKSQGIPVAFYNDQIMSMNAFFGKAEDALVMHHPEHKSDYCSFVIRVNYQGNFAFVTVDSYGESKLMKNAAQQEYLKNEAGKRFKSAVSRGNSFDGGFAVTAGARAGVKALVGALTGSKEKLEQEKMWYSCMSVILDNVIN